MEIKFKDIKTSRKIKEDVDLELIVLKADSITEGKVLTFNYKDTEDFKESIPDFTGYKIRLYKRLIESYKHKKFNIRSDRETGIIEIYFRKGK